MSDEQLYDLDEELTIRMQRAAGPGLQKELRALVINEITNYVRIAIARGILAPGPNWEGETVTDTKAVHREGYDEVLWVGPSNPCVGK